VPQRASSSGPSASAGVGPGAGAAGVSERLRRIQSAVAAGQSPDVSDLQNLSTAELTEYRKILLETVKRQRDELAHQIAARKSALARKEPVPLQAAAREGRALSSPPGRPIFGSSARRSPMSRVEAEA